MYFTIKTGSVQVYKKIISLFLCFLLLSGCSIPEINNQENSKNSVQSEYVKSVWITYYELSSLLIDKSEKEFKRSISKMFKELSSNGFNRVTVHIRPYADAFYNSSYFPISAYCCGVQGGSIDYDPMELMIETAHKYDLSFEAWINPYRVSSENDFSALSESNMAVKWQNTDNVISIDSGIYFNPGSEEVTELIVNGVKEIAENYNVDSICFDDYFYPSKDAEIDKNLYNAYKNNGGDKSLQDWRRDNVSNMVSRVYSTIKSVNGNITFGISPASNMENDYSSLYADVEKWCSQEGFVDYICPQIYFGFQNENQPFMKTVKAWCSAAICDLYVALPLYKAGKEDEFAGSSGINEFKENNNILARQVTYLSKLDKVKGYYIFSYSSLKDNDETKNLYSAMQISSSE